MKKITLSLLLIIAFPFLQKVAAQTRTTTKNDTITVVICRLGDTDTVFTFIVEGVCRNIYPVDLQPKKDEPNPKEPPMRNRGVGGYREDKTKIDY